MLEIESFKAQLVSYPVTPDVRLEKGVVDGIIDPCGLEETASNGSGNGVVRLPELQRQTIKFVQDPRRRICAEVEEGYWERISVDGRITLKKDHHVRGSGRYPNGGRLRELARVSSNGIHNEYGTNESDSSPEEIDWVSLDKVNADWTEPTIASTATFRPLKCRQP